VSQTVVFGACHVQGVVETIYRLSAIPAGLSGQRRCTPPPFLGSQAAMILVLQIGAPHDIQGRELLSRAGNPMAAATFAVSDVVHSEM